MLILCYIENDEYKKEKLPHSLISITIFIFSIYIFCFFFVEKKNSIRSFVIYIFSSFSIYR